MKETLSQKSIDVLKSLNVKKFTDDDYLDILDLLRSNISALIPNDPKEEKALSAETHMKIDSYEYVLDELNDLADKDIDLDYDMITEELNK